MITKLNLRTTSPHARKFEDARNFFVDKLKDRTPGVKLLSIVELARLISKKPISAEDAYPYLVNAHRKALQKMAERFLAAHPMKKSNRSKNRRRKSCRKS